MKKNIFLALAGLGAVAPMTQFVPWSNEYGFDLGVLVDFMFANQIAAGIAIDALTAAVAVIIWILIERKSMRVPYWWVPVIGMFAVGLAFALPMYLYLRERAVQTKV